MLRFLKSESQVLDVPFLEHMTVIFADIRDSFTQMLVLLDICSNGMVLVSCRHSLCEDSDKNTIFIVNKVVCSYQDSNGGNEQNITKKRN